MKASDNNFPKVRVVEGPAYATPEEGVVVIYAKADGALYSKNSDGIETPLGGGGGGGPGEAPVITLPGAQYTLGDLISGGWHEFTSDGQVTITVMDDSADPVPANAEYGVMAAGAGGVEIVVDDSAVIVPPKGGTLTLTQDAFAMLKRRAADSYKLLGETEDES